MGVLLLIVLLLALLGMPLFSVMGGVSALAWLGHPNPSFQFVRYLAPDVLDNRFAGSPILVTIPLFTFVGYLMAESKTPDRIVRASQAVLGWMPGGLAIVCIFSSAFFTTLTGGSGVTIVAIGGLLYPALRKQGYPDDFSLGLVTTGGSLGLLLPPSLPILIYALVAGIDFNKAFKAGLIPGFLIMVMLSIYSIYVAIKYKVPRSSPNLKEMGEALWLIKWELLVPVLILGGLGSGLTGIDEVAALAALYTLIIEIYVYKDLSWKKDIPRIVKSSMSLAGAIIVILAMANALINYAVQEHIPNKVLEALLNLGLSERWQFLIILNIFLVVLGMVMDGFSAILVAVPLIIPFAARFGLHPFHLAMMFLLNLEIAYCAPPLGLNLYIASFRFNRPVVSLYRVVLPALLILTAGLAIVMYIPKVSTVLVDRDSAALREEAKKLNQPPRDAWRLECVQDDMANPLPCTEEEKKLFPNGQMPEPPEEKSKKSEDKELKDKEADADSDESDDSIRNAFKKKLAGDKDGDKDEEKKDGDKKDESEETEDDEEDIRAKLRKMQNK
ncbi:MAG: TRAP transporter large permease [Myxococcales bacterium]|nr:TRAP transporter large permease [Polyangiaceae bacterium]MDW8248772.1 TRAP transporter large permease [Myxococcales bacterium]